MPAWLASCLNIVLALAVEPKDASSQIAFWFFEKNRRWSDRDRAPRTQKHCHSDVGDAKTR
jgi:hypothetical protein